MGNNKKMRGLRITCVLFMLWGLVSIAQADLIASYEASETSLSVTSLEFTPAIVTGGTAGAPAATEGTQLLKCTWTNQPDNKVEVKHTGLNFDLAGFNWLLFDIYTTTDLFAGSSNGVIGIWNGSWAPDWQAAYAKPLSAAPGRSFRD